MEENLKKCPKCGFYFDKNTKKCPICGYDSNRKIIKLRLTLYFVVLCLTFLSEFIHYIVTEETREFLHIDSILEKSQNRKPDEIVNIKIAPISSLSTMSKNEIFEKRKQYVKNSTVFSDIKNYSPNPDVYKIEDGLGWISAEQVAKYGVKNNKNITKGASRHSISVNNPDILITFLIPDYQGKLKERFSEELYLLPKRAKYNKTQKIITAYFPMNKFRELYPEYKRTLMYIDETNARDFGYDWFYVNSYNNISFKSEENNLAKNPQKMLGYYHKGYACGLDEGCNNYSPYQENSVFEIRRLPAHIEYKMWKKKPNFKWQKPDITYKMVFE